MELDKIYGQKINSIRISSKCEWYEYGEESSKFFLIWKNLELHKGQFEILQNMKKALHAIKELMKNFLIFIKSYFQKILM